MIKKLLLLLLVSNMYADTLEVEIVETVEVVEKKLPNSKEVSNKELILLIENNNIINFYIENILTNKYKYLYINGLSFEIYKNTTYEEFLTFVLQENTFFLEENNLFPDIQKKYEEIPTFGLMYINYSNIKEEYPQYIPKRYKIFNNSFLTNINKEEVALIKSLFKTKIQSLPSNNAHFVGIDYCNVNIEENAITLDKKCKLSLSKKTKLEDMIKNIGKTPERIAKIKKNISKMNTEKYKQVEIYLSNNPLFINGNCIGLIDKKIEENSKSIKYKIFNFHKKNANTTVRNISICYGGVVSFGMDDEPNNLYNEKLLENINLLNSNLN